MPTRRLAVQTHKDRVLAHLPLSVAEASEKMGIPDVRGMQRYTRPYFPRPENTPVNPSVRLTVHYVRRPPVRENPIKTFHSPPNEGTISLPQLLLRRDHLCDRQTSFFLKKFSCVWRQRPLWRNFAPSPFDMLRERLI